MRRSAGCVKVPKTEEIDIWRAANLLVKRRGADAEVIAFGDLWKFVLVCDVVQEARGGST